MSGKSVRAILQMSESWSEEEIGEILYLYVISKCVCVCVPSVYTKKVICISFQFHFHWVDCEPSEIYWFDKFSSRPPPSPPPPLPPHPPPFASYTFHSSAQNIEFAIQNTSNWLDFLLRTMITDSSRFSLALPLPHQFFFLYKKFIWIRFPFSLSLSHSHDWIFIINMK